RRPPDEQAIQLLRSAVSLLDTAAEMPGAARGFWQLARELGAAPEGLEELASAEARMRKLAGQARLALEHRTSGWQPADPARFAAALEEAKTTKGVTVDEAIARLRKRHG